MFSFKSMWMIIHSWWIVTTGGEGGLTLDLSHRYSTPSFTPVVIIHHCKVLLCSTPNVNLFIVIVIIIKTGNLRNKHIWYTKIPVALHFSYLGKNWRHYKHIPSQSTLLERFSLPSAADWSSYGIIVRKKKEDRNRHTIKFLCLLRRRFWMILVRGHSPQH